MIHMGVSDKGLTYFEQISGRQTGDVAEIKNHGAVLKKKWNIKPGVVKRTVDEPGMKAGAH
jgi:hypothetical protein